MLTPMVGFVGPLIWAVHMIEPVVINNTTNANFRESIFMGVVLGRFFIGNY
jgi:hypothetical protein